ncbi:MAG: hypothetical protein V7K63_12390 [Nostoc sp.]
MEFLILAALTSSTVRLPITPLTRTAMVLVMVVVFSVLSLIFIFRTHSPLWATPLLQATSTNLAPAISTPTCPAAVSEIRAIT